MRQIEHLGDNWRYHNQHPGKPTLHNLTSRHQIECVWFDPSQTAVGRTIFPFDRIKDIAWAHVMVFRVIAPEPRDFWIVKAGLFSDEDTARDVARDRGCEVIHVREVLE